MTKKWRVESSNTMLEEYIIEADSAEEARDIWVTDSRLNPVAIEHHEETIDLIEEIKQSKS